MEKIIRSRIGRRLLGILGAVIVAFGVMGANGNSVKAAELAAGTRGGDKTITITSPSGMGSSDTITYTVYKVFNASRSGAGAAYTALSTSQSFPIEAGDQLSKFDKDSAGNVHYYSRTSASGTYAEDTTTSELSASMVTKLGTLTKSFTNVGTVSITGPSTEKTVTVSDYGYYYITSTTGAAVSITTTHPYATVVDKNAVPTIDKNITGVTGQTISSGGVKSATADIGDTVTYTATITAKKGTDALYFHDKLSDGLTLVTNEVNGTQPLSITYKVGTSGTETTMTASGASGTVSAINYTQKRFDSAKAGTSDVNTDKHIESGDNIVLQFNGTFTDDTVITITYAAIVNEKAKIGSEGNPNDAKIDFGHQYSSSVETKATVYTYDLDLVKTGNTTTVITGAKFKLYKGTAGERDTVTKTGGDSAAAIQFIKTSASGTALYDTYRVALPSEISDSSVTKVDEIEAGYVRFAGLENGVYALEETQAPAGYHKLSDLVKIEVQDANNEATVTSTTSGEGASQTTTLTYSSGGVRVENTPGSLLPSTGGIGTTVFYIGGIALIAAAVIILVVRSRRNRDNYR